MAQDQQSRGQLHETHVSCIGLDPLGWPRSMPAGRSRPPCGSPMLQALPPIHGVDGCVVHSTLSVLCDG